MPDDSDDPTGVPDSVDDTPIISCERCGREWDLAYELDEMAVGNQAVQQFALDHHRHTGHFPDGVETWQAVCRHCPEEIQRLESSAARRWAETHARHTTHSVSLVDTDGETTVVDPPG
ncbi:hypothetical protein GJ629_07645 [Halapricum sp. CBA1109]|uniref:hypothetical protein n=1 Tax=Halapricum sp. CBA1109 TaxID=2668068 RepID=UPI0012F7DB6D|nr:hypothetical protein [Halapricum sp. CBA1109]MUV89784.1 hypothetical protein [Halapricum sp. CBA1109]